MPWSLIARLGLMLLAATGLRGAGAGIALAIRTVAVAVLATFAAVSGTAALTLAGPGPRWVAVVFGAAALAALTATVVEALAVRRAVQAIRLRRRQAEVRRAVGRAGSRGPR